MTAEFVRERISQLRVQKGVSEYKMSYDLGHSRGYINNISSGKSLPSMTEFFAICEYFGISPQDFFDHATPPPKNLKRATELLQELSPEHIDLLISLMEALPKQNKKEH